MPREPKREIVSFQGANGMVAAAVRLTGRKNNKKPKRAPGWYHETWRYYDVIGEYRYACSWVGNLLSRARLVVYKDGKPTDDSVAVAGLEALFGGTEGQREMLRQLGVHLTVAGDSYIVGEDMGDEPDSWSVVAATRISAVGEGDNMQWKVGNNILDDPLVIRLWKPHPQKHSESDSPSRAVLPILGEIEMLTKYVAAQGTSRLAGAGILAIPSEISFGSVKTAGSDDPEDGAPTRAGVDEILHELMETMMTAIEDQADASAKVPILFQGPGDYIDKIKHITFWTDFDENAKVLRDEAIRRLGLGMDMPPEVLTGTSDMNHWNAWQVEEASIKAHTEPLLQIITTSLTQAYLRPFLEDNGVSKEDARAYTIHADTSQMRLRPNRSKESIELFEHGELAARTMLTENGFDPDADAPSDEERIAWMTRKVAGGTVNPEIVAHALALIGIPIPQELIQIQERMTEARPDPSLLEHPTRELPESESDLTAAAAVVFRALEKAGARLKSKYKGSLVPGGEKVANENAYRYARIEDGMEDDLLLGAWECAETLGIRVSPVEMDSYARWLFASNEVFSPQHFREWLRKYS